MAAADDELDRLAGGPQGRRELARLALEFRRLERSMDEDERRADLVEMKCPSSISYIVSAKTKD